MDYISKLFLRICTIRRTTKDDIDYLLRQNFESGRTLYDHMISLDGEPNLHDNEKG